LERAARGGGARHHPGTGAARTGEGARAGAHQVRRLPALLHAPHRALARARRARRGRLQDRRRVAGARAGHGDDGRAGHLPAGGRARGAEALPQYRRAHRGRGGGHQARRRGADRARAQGPRPDRSTHGARLSMATATPLEVDVAVVGGGMVGASLAAALAGSGRSLLLIESVPFGADAQPSFDERTTALGNASRRIFEGLGVWGAIAPEAAAIRAIHVSEAGRFGFARLEAAAQGIDAFGYVAANRRIGAALWRRLAAAPDLKLRVPARAQDIDIAAGRVRFTVLGADGAAATVSARLVVAADGAHSQIRAAAGIAADVEDYDQVAVVANVAADRPHQECAFERFTAEGPLAVLPLYDGNFAVIWACRPAHAREVLALDDVAYLARLQQQFGWRAGRFVRASRRGSYPLQLTRPRSRRRGALHRRAGEAVRRPATRGAAAAQPRPPDVRSRPAGQERAGTRQPRLRRSGAAPRPRPAGAPCMRSSWSAAARSGPASGRCSRAAPAAPGRCRWRCSSRSPPQRRRRTRRSRRAWWRCRVPASGCSRRPAPGAPWPARACARTSACASGTRASLPTATGC